jgi:hypothetical protein
MLPLPALSPISPTSYLVILFKGKFGDPGVDGRIILK